MDFGALFSELIETEMFANIIIFYPNVNEAFLYIHFTTISINKWIQNIPTIFNSEQIPLQQSETFLIYICVWLRTH